MASADYMLEMYNRMRSILPQIIQPAEQSITVWEASERAMNRNVATMAVFLGALKQIISTELQAHREAMQATQAQEEFNQELDESAKKGNKLIEAFKKMDLSKIVSTGKEFLGRILSDGAQQQTAIDQLSFRAGSPGAGQQIFDQTASQALRYGQDVDTAMAGTQKFMSITTDPGQLAELNMLAMRLEQLNPGQGLEGAADALSQVLSGSTEGLGSYDISAGTIDNSGLQTAGQQGNVNGVIAAMDQLLNKQRMTRAAFETMMDSPSAKWNSIIETLKFKLGNAGMNAAKSLTPVFNKILSVINSKAFDKFITGLKKSLDTITILLDGLASGALWVSQVIEDNWPAILGILAGIGTALTIMAVQQIPNLITQLWAMIPPILAQAAAWLFANWWVLAIAAVVAGLVFLLAQSGVTLSDVVGAIIGAFEVMKVYFENVIIGFKNGLSSFKDFFANLFIDPVYAVKKSFYDMVLNVLDNFVEMARGAEGFAGGLVIVIGEAINLVLGYFQSIIDGIAFIPGFEFLKGKKIPLIDTSTPAAVIEHLEKARDNFRDNFKPTSDKNVFETPKLPVKTAEDYQNAWNGGFKKGQDLVSEGTKAAEDFMNSILSDDNSKLPHDINRVGEVGKINDTVDISSEDLKMMRELAELKNVQNFVTLQPSISFGDTHVRQQSDINTIIAHITEKLEQDIVTSADAVYGW